MALMTKHEYIFLQSTVAESIIESNSSQDQRKAYDMRAVQLLSIVNQSKADFGLINGVRETLSRYGLRQGILVGKCVIWYYLSQQHKLFSENFSKIYLVIYFVPIQKKFPSS